MRRGKHGRVIKKNTCTRRCARCVEPASKRGVEWRAREVDGVALWISEMIH